MAKPIHECSATELAARMKSGALSPTTVTDTFLRRIDEQNPELNAFITVTAEQARKKAKQAEAQIETGEQTGPLHGVPVAIKDLLGYKEGVRHTFGMKPFADHVAQTDSILVERLESAGAIVLGKTNTPELGYKSTTDNKLLGATANPFDREKISGGSSGGSCAALAAGLTPIATGSDIGGSLRIPASACGVVGFYPSFARIPHNHPTDAYLSEPPFLQPGPLARTVKDIALMLDVLVGPDDRDPFALPRDESSSQSALDHSVQNFTIGYSPDLDLFPVESVVDRTVSDAVMKLQTVGATVSETEIELTHSLTALGEAYMTQWQVYIAELAAVFEHPPYGVNLLDHSNELPEELLEMIEQGQQIGAVDYRLANRVRTDFHRALTKVFETYDVLVTPTLAVPPFDKTREYPEKVAEKSAHWDLAWVLTWPTNMTGHPSLSLPAGFTDAGLPIGLQVIGPRYADDRVLAVGSALEECNPWQDQYPFHS